MNILQKPKYITKLKQLDNLSEEYQNKLEKINEKFVFRSNTYYNSLIDWDDPNDPIKTLIIPNTDELQDWGKLDASNESKYIKLPGLEHKYNSTVLLLVNEVCGAYCRFCFRKRLFMNDNDEVVKDITKGVEYIKKHKEITNVLLTGGDPLILSNSKLEPILNQLCEIEHIRIIRIGTKMPAFNPFRIINDIELFNIFKSVNDREDKQIYIMAHFNHPRELTDDAVKGLDFLKKTGCTIVNQTPLVKNVNDNANTLIELFNKLSFIGIPPYYVFQLRPTLGNKAFIIPIETSYNIIEEAKSKISGLAKKARFVMSHESGKIEISGLTKSHIIFKYLRAADNKNNSKVMVFKRNPNAYWFDDYKEQIDI